VIDQAHQVAMQLRKHGRRPRTCFGYNLRRPAACFGVGLSYQGIEFVPVESGFRKGGFSELLKGCPAWYFRANYRVTRVSMRCMLSTRLNQTR
jgi:hypothetical protein